MCFLLALSVQRDIGVKCVHGQLSNWCLPQEHRGDLAWTACAPRLQLLYSYPCRIPPVGGVAYDFLLRAGRCLRCVGLTAREKLQRGDIYLILTSHDRARFCLFLHIRVYVLVPILDVYSRLVSISPTEFITVQTKTNNYNPKRAIYTFAAKHLTLVRCVKPVADSIMFWRWTRLVLVPSPWKYPGYAN